MTPEDAKPHDEQDLLSDSLQANGYSEPVAEELARLAETQLLVLQERAASLDRSTRRLERVSLGVVSVSALAAAAFGFSLAERLGAGGFQVPSVVSLLVAAAALALAAYQVLRARRWNKRVLEQKVKMEHISDQIDALSFGVAVKSVSPRSATLRFTGGKPTVTMDGDDAT